MKRIIILLFLSLFIVGCNNGDTLTGVKVAMFGDSITEFGNYPKYVSNLTGATTYKIGFGGCRMGYRNIDSIYTNANAYNAFSMVEISNCIKLKDYSSLDYANEFLVKNKLNNYSKSINTLKSTSLSDCDIITIFFGTNDFTSNENPIGDSDSMNPFELKGAMNIILNNLSQYQDKRIIFVSPIHRYFKKDNNKFDCEEEPNSIGLYLQDYVDAIKEQSEYKNIEFLDMYSLCGLNAKNHWLYFDFSPRTLSIDTTHPNALGYHKIAKAFSKYLTQ